MISPLASRISLLVSVLACLLAAEAHAQFIQTGAGPWDYNDPANWNAGTINGNFTQTPSTAQTVTFLTNTTLATALTFNLGGTSPVLTLRGSGGDFTVTLGGAVNVNGTNTSSITFGSATANQNLNIALGGSDRTFTVDSGNTLSVLNVISGGNALVKAGAGTLTLSGANTFTGGTTINGGTLLIGISNALVSTTNVVVNGTTAGTTTSFNLNSGLTQTIGSLTFGGAGATSTSVNSVSIGSGSTLTLGGTVTYDATNNPLASSISGGTLALGATRTFDIGDSSNVTGNPELFINSSVSGTGFGIVKTGVGTLQLAGANTFSGGVVINQGTITVGASNSLVAATDVVVNGTTAGITRFNLNAGLTQTIRALTFGGAGANSGFSNTVSIAGTSTLTLGGAVTVDATNNPVPASITGGILSLGATRTFDIGDSTNAPNDLLISAIISGTGFGIIKTGAGTLFLSGANTFDGGVVINDGTLTVGASNSLVATTNVVVNGTTAGTTTRLSLNNGVTQTIGSLTFGGAGATSTSTNQVSVNAGRTLTLGGTVTYDATNNPLGASISNGTLALGSTRTFNLGDSSNATSELTISSVITGIGFGLVKTGPGLLRLQSGNTYDGGTTVSGGVLRVDNATGSGVGTGNLDVLSGALLRGSGFLDGATTIHAGASLGPGTPANPNTLTFENGLTLQASSSLGFQLGTASDRLVVGGGTLAGPASGLITINLSDGGGFGAGTYTLFDFTGASTSSFDVGDFMFGTIPFGSVGDYSLALVGSTLQLTTSAIPEPATWAALLGAVALGVAVCRRRAQRLSSRPSHRAESAPSMGPGYNG